MTVLEDLYYIRKKGFCNIDKHQVLIAGNKILKEETYNIHII